jgi:hypothetical protein
MRNNRSYALQDSIVGRAISYLIVHMLVLPGATQVIVK